MAMPIATGPLPLRKAEMMVSGLLSGQGQALRADSADAKPLDSPPELRYQQRNQAPHVRTGARAAPHASQCGPSLFRPPSQTPVRYSRPLAGGARALVLTAVRSGPSRRRTPCWLVAARSRHLAAHGLNEAV